MGYRWLVCLAAGLALLGCTPAPAAPPQRQATAGTSAVAPQRTLNIIVRGERPTLAITTVGGLGNLEPPGRLFNAMLDYVDHTERPNPYLAEALPKLNTDTWRVSPDGRMETTYRLKPNLVWHDGTPLEAEDFVFAFTVFKTDELGHSREKPLAQMREVTAPDARTVVISWNVLYPEADRLDSGFQALPRHLLAQPFATMVPATPEGFINHGFWTADYVGLGPFKVDRLEQGSYLEAVAFDRHVLGRPKVDRVRLTPIPDANTALANMLSGDTHMLTDFIFDYELGNTLQQQWAEIQFRPEFVSPQALTDARVRRALVHGIDVPGAVNVFGGEPTSTFIHPRVSYYAQVERVAPKRPFDVATTQRLLDEAGFRRGADGMYISSSGERLTLEFWDTGGRAARETAIFVDSLRQAGVDAIPHTVPAAQGTDREFRAKLPAFSLVGASDDLFSGYTADTIPSAQNGWRGSNRGGWINAEFNRIWEIQNRTLEEEERIRQNLELERIMYTDVGAIPLYFQVVVTAHAGSLKGMVARMTPDAPNAMQNSWLWEWTS
jgi:peptide/nickel transport system substrate-binding protein